MSNVVSLLEHQFAARICDLLYFAYESGNPKFIELAAALATKSVNLGVSDSEICEVEQQLKP